MSYIDGYRHELVGLFAGLPVYHPLEDIPGSPFPVSGDDFACSTGQLVIGGGGGERPGLVVLDPAAAVAFFVFYSGSFEGVEAAGLDFTELLRGAPVFNFAGWEAPDYHAFLEMCASPCMLHPFDCGGDLGFNDWLACGVGEFIYYAMPELAREVVAAAAVFHTERDHILYNNISLLPPNMPVYASGGNAFVSRRKG